MVETARLARATRIVLAFVPGEAGRAMWPHRAEPSLAVPVGTRLRQDARIRRQGPIAGDGEVDRIYRECPGDVVVVDPTVGRRIRIARQGSRGYVLRKPWVDRAARLGDLGEEGYRRMLGVETANAGDDQVSVAPGQTVAPWTECSVEPR